MFDGCVLYKLALFNAIIFVTGTCNYVASAFTFNSNNVGISSQITSKRMYQHRCVFSDRICPPKDISSALRYSNPPLDDENEESNNNDPLFFGEPLWTKNQIDDKSWSSDLTARFEKLKHDTCIHNWFQAKCKTTIQCAIDDAVRKLAWDPESHLVVCGSSNGTLYLCNLTNGEVLDRREDAHKDMTVDDSQKHLRKLMCGNFDEGAAIVDIAMKGNLVVSCGRDDDNIIKLWQIEQDYDEMLMWSVEDAKCLVPVGNLKLPPNTLATKLHFDAKGNLYVTASDGYLRFWSKASLNQIPVKHNDIFSDPSSFIEPTSVVDICSSDRGYGDQKVTSPALLDISIAEDLGLGLCATASGSIVLFKVPNIDSELNFDNKLNDPLVISTIRDILRPNVHMRSVLLVSSGNYLNDESSMRQQSKEKANGDHMEGNSEKWSIICGGGDGSLYRISLNVESGNKKSANKFPSSESYDGKNNSEKSECQINLAKPFALVQGQSFTNEKLRPSHTGPVMCLVSPAPGVFLSGAQDGTIRIWDCTLDASFKSLSRRKPKDKEGHDFSIPKCRYALFGYKLWLGSICTDGLSFISDGRDNTIIMRDFTVTNILDQN